MRLGQDRKEQVYNKLCQAIVSKISADSQYMSNSLKEALELGLNDSVWNLIFHYINISIRDNLELFYFIQLFNSLMLLQYRIPCVFVEMFQRVFTIFFRLNCKNQIDKVMNKIKEWNQISPNLVCNLRDCIKKTIQNELAEKYDRKNIRNKNFSEETSVSQANGQNLLPRKIVKLDVRGQEKDHQRKNTDVRCHIQKARMILKNMKKDKNYQCRQCGKFYTIKQNYDQHKKQHFDQRLQRFLKKNKKSAKVSKRNAQDNEKKWIRENQEVYIDCYAPAKIQNIQMCLICNKQLMKNYINDQWVFVNCIRCYQNAQNNNKSPQIQHIVLYNEKNKLFKNIQDLKIVLAHIQCYKGLKSL